MREIKFRAWDNKKKKMEKIDGIMFSDKFGNSIIKISTQFEPPAHEKSKKDSPSFEIMQFTGLKDKNSREIYEGDIVDDGSFSYEVFWSSECAQFMMRNSHTGGAEIPQYCQIIGTIYENPEILK